MNAELDWSDMIVRVQRSRGPGSNDPTLRALVNRCLAAVLGALTVTGIAVMSVWVATSAPDGTPAARGASARSGSSVVVGQFVVPGTIGGLPLVSTVGPISVTASLTPRGWVVTLVGPVYSVAVSAADVPGGAATLRAVVADLVGLPGGPDAVRLAPVRPSRPGSIPAAPIVVVPPSTDQATPTSPPRTDPVPSQPQQPVVTPTVPEPPAEPSHTPTPEPPTPPTASVPESTEHPTPPTVSTPDAPDPTTAQPADEPTHTQSDVPDREGSPDTD